MLTTAANCSCEEFCKTTGVGQWLCDPAYWLPSVIGESSSDLGPIVINRSVFSEMLETTAVK